MNLKNTISQLQELKHEYKNLVFWSWNDKLEKEQLISQIADLDDKGFGGFFMHARSGLKTEYLGDEWFDAVDVCIKEAKKRKMDAWLYDENGWPSGFVGGKLLENKEFIEKAVKADTSSSFNKNASFSYYKENNKFIRTDSPVKTDVYYNIYIYDCPSNVDILNPKCVDAFIKETHEKYYERFKEEFGKTVKGFFTDEPQYFQNDTPFSFELVNFFKDNYNEDIFDNLILLFFEGDNQNAFRYKYWNALNTLFTQNYFKKLYDWCEAHNCKLTGHLIDERTFEGQMYCCAGVMPSYKYEHIPGIDNLERYPASIRLSKQVSSVAKQTGKKQVLTETFAMTGWNTSFNELKWNINVQYVGGVNLNCVHLYPYSMRGERNTDHPCIFGYFDSWWDNYKYLNTYFSRLGFLLGESRENCNVAVFNTIKSGYLTWNRHNRRSICDVSGDFYRTTKKLVDNNILFDYVDDSMLLTSSVKKGILKVGKCRYKYLIVPNCHSIDKHTSKVFENYIKNGGKILFMGDIPSLVEGVPFDNSILQSNFSYNEILDNEEFSAIRREGGIYSTLRCGKFGKFLFVVNRTKDKKSRATFKIKGLKNAFKLDLDTLNVSAVKTIGDTLDIELNGMGYALIFLNAKFDNSIAKIYENFLSVNNFNKVSVQDNYFPLDRACYSFDGVNYNSVRPVYAIKQELLEKRFNGDVYLKFSFLCKNNIANLAFSCNNMNIKSVTVNGNFVSLNKNGVIFKEFVGGDISEFCNIGNNELIIKLHHYQNDIVYQVLFGKGVSETLVNCMVYDTEIDDVYLFGNFGVFTDCKFSKNPLFIETDNNFYLDNLSNISQSDTVQNGLPFYKGKIVGSFNCELTKNDYLFKLNGDFATAEITVNGKHTVPVLSDNQAFISADLLNNGLNSLDITVFSGNRNLLGPRHFKTGESWSVARGTFYLFNTWKNGKSIDYIDNKTFFVPFGLNSVSILKAE